MSKRRDYWFVLFNKNNKGLDELFHNKFAFSPLPYLFSWRKTWSISTSAFYNKKHFGCSIYYLSMRMKFIFSKSEFSRINFEVIKIECNCQPSSYASYKNTKIDLFIFGVKWMSRKSTCLMGSVTMLKD